MTKNFQQIQVGDVLLFAGQWHAVVRLSYFGKYATLCFKTYPPVIVRVDDKFEVS
jgi:hypothetical protein